MPKLHAFSIRQWTITVTHLQTVEDSKSTHVCFIADPWPVNCLVQ